MSFGGLVGGILALLGLEVSGIGYLSNGLAPHSFYQVQYLSAKFGGHVNISDSEDWSSNMFRKLASAILTRSAVLFTLPVSGFNDVAERCELI